MEVQGPFFSIIMPIYNVESYLAEAVNSVLKQTFSEFELILVNDCATDASGKIADELSKIDTRISVIRHIKNRGLSAARNSGLALAQGNYIFFMDSDDTIDSNLLQMAYDSIQKNQAELIVFGATEEYFDSKKNLQKLHSIIPGAFITTSKVELRKRLIVLENQTLLGYAWNKIYSLKTLKQLDLQFENITLIEDIIFNIKFCEDISSLNILEFAPYHYKKRWNNSLTNIYVSDYFILHRKRIEVIWEQYQKWNLLNDDVYQILGRIYMRYIYSALERNSDSKSEMTFNDQIRWCKSLYIDSFFSMLIKEKYKPSKFLFRIMLYPLKYQKTYLLIVLAYIIHFIKKYAVRIYWCLKVK